MTADELIAQAKAERRDGNLSQAADLYRRAAQQLRDDSLRYAHAIRHAADILREAGHSESAESDYIEAIGIYRRSECSPLDMANALRGYALLAEMRLQNRHAAQLWQEARSLYLQAGVDAGVQEADQRLAGL